MQKKKKPKQKHTTKHKNSTNKNTNKNTKKKSLQVISEWATKVATPPSPHHIRLLIGFFLHSLRMGAFERVYTVLSFLQRYVRSLYPSSSSSSLSSSSPPSSLKRKRNRKIETKQQQIYALWAVRFNEVLGEVQTACQDRGYGSLPFQPFC